MPKIETEQYAIVMHALLESSRHNNVSSDPETSKMVAEAMQVLKSIMKGKPSTSFPTGGSSYCGCFSCKGTRIRSLMHMFGIHKRIGR